MNCTSEVQYVPGLKTRRPKGLRRPTKEIPGLGSLEYAREERCLSWQMSHQFVPTRLTLIDAVLNEKEESEENAVEIFHALAKKERAIRERVVHAWYFDFVEEESRSASFDEIIAHLDDWVAPYRVDRWYYSGFNLKYDCSDGPNGMVLGAAQIHVSVDLNWSISDVRCFTSGIADELRVAAYRQRVPTGCFLVDSIADQFIVTSHVTPNPELASLLSESINQTDSLRRASSGSAEAFLREAHLLLCRVREERFTDFA